MCDHPDAILSPTPTGQIAGRDKVTAIVEVAKESSGFIEGRLTRVAVTA